jgi:hypothetical protein
VENMYCRWLRPSAVAFHSQANTGWTIDVPWTVLTSNYYEGGTNGEYRRRRCYTILD